MKILTYTMIMLVMITSVFAVVTKTTLTAGDNVYRYNSDIVTSVMRGYWAVNEDVPSGCIVSGVTCTAEGLNADCAYHSGTDTIRVVAYTLETGGQVANAVTVTVSGTGSCILNNAEYVESWNDGAGNIELGGITGFLTDADLVLSSQNCNTVADTNCDGCVHDSEFPLAVNDWKGSQTYITDAEFPFVVNNWKAQTGCA